jgi:CysZ protein
VQNAEQSARPARPGFGAGVSAVFAGFKTIMGTPSLWPWALVPVVVMFALGALLMTLGWEIAGNFIGRIVPAIPGEWGPVLGGLLNYLALAVFIVICWFVAVLLAPPLSAPALEHIVRRVENELGVPPRESIGFFREVICGFRALAGGLVVTLPIFVILWIVEFIFAPVAVVTTPLKFVVSSLLVAWGLFDYPLTLRGIGFRSRLELMRENFASVLGFGLAFALVFWVPCCGVALLPVGAAAATRLLAQIEGFGTSGGTPTGGGVAGSTLGSGTAGPTLPA